MDGDAELVARAQRGDERAFEALVARYSTKVFRLAVSILGQEFVPEAEDVAQEVFLKIHRAITTFRSEAEFGSWVYRITFNEAVNLKARVRYKSPHLNEAALVGAAALGPGPQSQAEAAMRDQVIEDCIQTLPEVYQSALRLYYWMDEGVSDVARMLGVPENTAKSYLHRARRLLSHMLKDKGYDNE